MKLRPGDTAPQTGTYKVFDKLGNQVNTVSLRKGQSLPPTQESGYYYEY